MRVPYGALFPVVAVLFVALAVWAGPNYAVAVPATVAAVAAAGATAFEVYLRAAPPARDAPSGRRRPVPSVRELFVAGPASRTEIVGLLDRIDREGDHPDRPRATPRELRSIVGMSDDEFLRLVRARLDELEANS